MKLWTLILGGAFTVLIALFLVPAGLSAVRPDDRPDARGPGVVSATTQPVHPNDRAGPLGPGGVELEKQAGWWKGERDYGLFTPTGEIAKPVVAEPAVVAAPAGFDWTPVVYAMIAAALVLLLGATTLAVHHRAVHHRGGPGRPVPH